MKNEKQRSPMILVPLFAAATAAVYMALVQPSLTRLGRERQDLQNLRNKVEAMSIDLRSKDSIRERIKRADEELARYDKVQLEPLLESYAMRAKSIVGELAEKAGLVDAEFQDRPALALPVLPGSPRPTALHSRLPVVVSCFGDYAAIVSFVMRVERDLPYVALESLKITPSGSNPDLQRAEIVLEWPTKGAGK